MQLSILQESYLEYEKLYPLKISTMFFDSFSWILKYFFYFLHIVH